jgi:hypothetical protein
MPFAVAICKNPLDGKQCVAMVQWEKTPAVIPVPLKLEKNESPYASSLQLSPSGKWACFYTSKSGQPKYYVMHVNTALPTGCLPPMALNIQVEVGCKATWVTNPEGLVIWDGNYHNGKLMYWDLSAVDLGKITGQGK